MAWLAGGYVVIRRGRRGPRIVRSRRAKGILVVPPDAGTVPPRAYTRLPRPAIVSQVASLTATRTTPSGLRSYAPAARIDPKSRTGSHDLPESRARLECVRRGWQPRRLARRRVALYTWASMSYLGTSEKG